MLVCKSLEGTLTPKMSQSYSLKLKTMPDWSSQEEIETPRRSAAVFLKRSRFCRLRRKRLAHVLRVQIRATVWSCRMIKICPIWPTSILELHHRRSEGYSILAQPTLGSWIRRPSLITLNTPMMILFQTLHSHSLRLPKSLLVQESSLDTFTLIIFKSDRETNPSRLPSKSLETLSNKLASSTVSSKPSSAWLTLHSLRQVWHQCLTTWLSKNSSKTIFSLSFWRSKMRTLSPIWHLDTTIRPSSPETLHGTQSNSNTCMEYNWTMSRLMASLLGSVERRDREMIASLR